MTACTLPIRWFPAAVVILVLLFGPLAAAGQAGEDSVPVMAEGTSSARTGSGGDGWRSLWSSTGMPGWQTLQYGGAGDIAFSNGVLTIGRGATLTGLVYTNPVPRIHYEIEVENKRVAGHDFSCGLTFPVGDTSCTLVFGGWGGGLVGISSIDGLDASENQTGQYHAIENGRWYHLRVRVSPARILVWLDHKPIIRQELENHSIGMRPGEIEMCQPFGLTTYETVGAFRGLRLRVLPGTPRP